AGRGVVRLRSGRCPRRAAADCLPASGVLTQGWTGAGPQRGAVALLPTVAQHVRVPREVAGVPGDLRGAGTGTGEGSEAAADLELPRLLRVSNFFDQYIRLSEYKRQE